MSRLLLRLSVLAVILAVVLSAPSVERERRASKFSRFFSKIGSGIKNVATKVGQGVKKAAVAVGKGVKKAATSTVGKVLTRVAVPWFLPFPLVPFVIGATVDDEAGLLWARTDDSINNGNNLVDEGQKLLNEADKLEKDLGNDVGKRAAGGKAKGIKAVIDALRAVAQRAIDAGKKVIKNSDKIKAAFQDAVIDISEVVTVGVADVGAALSDVGDSISKAGQVLEGAKAAADNANEGFGEALQELDKAGKLALEAGQTFEEVGKRSLSLAEAVYKLGKNLVEVFAKAAKNIAKASGITGKK